MYTLELRIDLDSNELQIVSRDTARMLDFLHRNSHLEEAHDLHWNLEATLRTMLRRAIADVGYEQTTRDRKLRDQRQRDRIVLSELIDRTREVGNAPA